MVAIRCTDCWFLLSAVVGTVVTIPCRDVVAPAATLFLFCIGNRLTTLGAFTDAKIG